MTCRLIVPALAVLAAFATPAAAQDRGGITLAPQNARGPTGLARMLPFVPFAVSAADVQASLKATDHSARHQEMIAHLRGDAGYLGGFAFGRPLSASVQPIPRVQLAPEPDFGYADGQGYGGDPGYADGPGGGGRRGPRQIVLNQIDVTTYQGPVVIGSNNNVQQQTANGSGPIALQQVLSQAGASGTGGNGHADRIPLSLGGAVNAIDANGRVVQRVPGAARSPAYVAAPR
jgi:hypothetical protein